VVPAITQNGLSMEYCKLSDEIMVPAITQNGLSMEYCQLSDEIMSL